jgi:hypothetical protein
MGTVSRRLQSEEGSMMMGKGSCCYRTTWACKELRCCRQQGEEPCCRRLGEAEEPSCKPMQCEQWSS